MMRKVLGAPPLAFTGSAHALHFAKRLGDDFPNLDWIEIERRHAIVQKGGMPIFLRNTHSRQLNSPLFDNEHARVLKREFDQHQIEQYVRFVKLTVHQKNLHLRRKSENELISLKIKRDICPTDPVTRLRTPNA